MEAVEAAEWLGEEVMEVFQVREEGVGCGSVTGETRGKLVQAREQTRAKLLIKALEQFRRQKALATSRVRVASEGEEGCGQFRGGGEIYCFGLHH